MELKRRDWYLEQLIAFQDTDLVKVITGIRRCGKSSLLELMADHLRQSGVEADQIVFMNFESMQYEDMDSKALYRFIMERSANGKRMYLFFDEIQKVPQWQNAVNSFRVDLDCDIYITGSNAFLLSSELSTYLSGRYVEIKMLPLSFAEFLDFQGYTLETYRSPLGMDKKRAVDTQGKQMDMRELFDAYIRFGGMPAIAETGLNRHSVNMLLDGIYSAVVVRDILERGRRKEQRAITDARLLRKIILFLADNIGNNVSVRSISNTLVSEGMADRAKPAVQTISAYIDALLESYIFYEVKRFDIKGKDYLRTLGKYYIVDTGLRSYLLGDRGGDTGHLLENVIFLELIRRGYDVAVGKIGDREVDFIVNADGTKQYIQVSETISAPETRERELAPLMAIHDNYEKIIVTMDHVMDTDIEGIKIVNALDFLLDTWK